MFKYPESKTTKKKSSFVYPGQKKEEEKSVENTPKPLPSQQTKPLPKLKETKPLPPIKKGFESGTEEKPKDTLFKKAARFVLPKSFERKFNVEKEEDKPMVFEIGAGLPNKEEVLQRFQEKEAEKAPSPKYQKSTTAFLKGLKPTKEDIPYYGDIRYNIPELIKVNSAFKAIEKGTATEKQEKDYFNWMQNEMAKQDLMENKGYKIGSTIKESAKFMAELAPVALSEVFTGSVAPSGEAYAAKKVSEKGLLKVLKESLTSKSSKMIAKKYLKDTTKKATKLFAKQMAVTAPTRVTKGTLERMVGIADPNTGEVLKEGQPINEAIVNATTGHATELITELGGGVSGKVLSSMAKPAKDVLVKTAIVQAMKRKLKGASEEKVVKALEKVGWNGVMSEWFEERDADILNQAFASVGLGDQEFDGLTIDDITTEIASFGLMGAGVKTISSVADIKQYLNNKQQKTEQETIEEVPKETPQQIQQEIPQEVPKQLPPLKKEFQQSEVQVKEQKETIKPTKLEQEAKKYDTAEEFIKKQGETVYHGTSKEISQRIEKDGFITKKSIGRSKSPDANFIFVSPSKQIAENYVGKGMGVKIPFVVEAKINGNLFEIDKRIFSDEAENIIRNELKIPNNISIKDGLIDNGFIGYSFKDIQVRPGEDIAYGIIPSQIKTKKQLEEIYNKATQKQTKPTQTEDILIEEARKYDTAEEFIKAQGMPVYHGTNKKFETFNDKNLKTGWLGKGIYFTPNKSYARENGKILKEVFLYIKRPFIVKGDSTSDVLSEIKEKYSSVDEFNISEVLKEQGYDSIKFNHWDKGEIVAVFDNKIIKTKSQLEEIYKKTQETVESTQKPKKVPVSVSKSKVEEVPMEKVKTQEGKKITKVAKDIASRREAMKKVVLKEAKKKKSSILKKAVEGKEGMEVSARIEENQRKLENLNQSIVSGIKNSSYWKKEKSVKDDMGVGYLMEKNGKYLVATPKEVTNLVLKGYKKGMEIDSLAQEAGFESGLEYLENQVELSNISKATNVKRIVEKELKDEEYLKAKETIKKTSSEEILELAGYTPRQIEEQKRRASKIIKGDKKLLKEYLTGEKEVPQEVSELYLAVLAEEEALKNNDLELSNIIQNSPIISRSSWHGSELRMLAERNKYLPSRVTTEVKRIKEKQAPKNIEQSVKKDVQSIQKKSKKKTIRTKKTFLSALEELTC